MSTARAAHGKIAAFKKLEVTVSQRWDLFPYLIVVLALFTVVSLFHVWSRVRVIDLNLQITEADRQMKNLQQEKSRLKLEIASLKTPSRIESLAKGELGMVLPADQQVIVVK
jgi:cell division protein FtsL